MTFRCVRYKVYTALFLISVLVSTTWVIPSHAQEATKTQPEKAEVATPEASQPQQSPDPKAATTTKDVAIPLDELQILVKPMTLGELSNEVAGWMQIAEDKAKEVSQAEVTIRRQNDAILKQKEAADQLEKAQQALKDADQAQQGATVGSPEYQEAAKKIEQAKENLKKAQDAVEEAKQTMVTLQGDRTVRQVLDASKKDSILNTAKQTLDQLKSSRDKIDADSPDYAEATNEVDQLGDAISNVEKAQELQQSAKPDSPDAAKADAASNQAFIKLEGVLKEIGAATSNGTANNPASPQNLNNSTAAVENTTIQSSTGTTANSETAQTIKPQDLQQKQKQLEQATENLQKSSDAESQAKNQLVVSATDLQSQLADIADRSTIVLDAFEKKGGDAKPYRDYLKVVTTVEVDTRDAQGLQVRALAWLQSEQGGVHWTINIAKFLGIIFVSFIISHILGHLLNKFLARFSNNLSRVMRNFIVMLVKRGGILVGLLLALTALEVNLGPVLALLGGVSFILAFALQSNLGNFASGLMLMLYKPFDVGDDIKLGNLRGFVQDISLASTKIRGLDGQMFSVPNNQVWGGTIENLAPAKLRKVVIVLKVGFDEDLVRVEEVMLDIMKSHPKIEKEPAPSTYAFGIDNYFINLACNSWARTDAYFGVYNDMVHNIKERFDKEGIKLAAIPRSATINYSPSDVESNNGKIL